RLLVAVAFTVACAVAATLAVGRSGPAFHAHRNVLAVDRHISNETVEGPIESFTMAEQRAMKQTAPFQTVADGAHANAMSQRAEKAKSGGARGAGRQHSRASDDAHT